MSVLVNLINALEDRRQALSEGAMSQALDPKGYLVAVGRYRALGDVLALLEEARAATEDDPVTEDAPETPPKPSKPSKPALRSARPRAKHRNWGGR